MGSPRVSAQVEAVLSSTSIAPAVAASVVVVVLMVVVVLVVVVMAGCSDDTGRRTVTPSVDVLA